MESVLEFATPMGDDGLWIEGFDQAGACAELRFERGH